MERLANELSQRPVEKVPCQRAQTLVNDVVLWKELQQELRNARANSPIAIQEITRKFMEKHQPTLDDIQSASNNRRASNPDYTHARLSSMQYIAERSKSIRRALSLGHDSNAMDAISAKLSLSSKRQEAIVQRESQNHQSLNLRNGETTEAMNIMSIGKMSESLGNLKVDHVGKVSESPSILKIDHFLPFYSSRNKAHLPSDDAYDIFYAATAISRVSLETMESDASQLNPHPRLDTHVEDDSESLGSGDGMTSDDDLLVMFPTRPRRTSNSNRPISRAA
jgi:hypothetical protein